MTSGWRASGPAASRPEATAMPPILPELIARLWCLHWPAERLAAAPVTELRASGVFLDTCLRQLAFGLAPRPRLSGAPAFDLSTGPEAYRLLLEVASGLRSAVPGETNVFGQFRRAAEQAASLLAPDDWRHLRPVVEALQADTRALRASHLQGLAGSSYGSLVRALLAPRPDARVLFIGTGELARSMVPLFQAFGVGTWNHRSGPPLREAARSFATLEADEAAGWATDVVFTTPRHPDHDAAWRERFRPHALRGLVHLGQRHGEPFNWPSVAASFTLDNVFALAGSRDQHRRQQLAAAALACTARVEARLKAARPLRAAAAPGHAPSLAPA